MQKNMERRGLYKYKLTQSQYAKVLQDTDNNMNITHKLILQGLYLNSLLLVLG